MRPADALPEDVRGVLARVHNPEYAHRFTHDGYCASDEPLNHGPCDCSHRETVADVSLLAATVERLAADRARLSDALDGLYDRVHAIPTLELRGAKDADGLYVQRSQVHFAITAARRATTTDQGEG